MQRFAIYRGPGTAAELTSQCERISCEAATSYSPGSTKRAPASIGAAPGFVSVPAAYLPGGFGGFADESAREVVFYDEDPGAAIGSRKLANLTPGYILSLLRSWLCEQSRLLEFKTTLPFQREGRR